MLKAIRASIFHCLADPGESSDSNAWEFFEDGMLLVDGDKVVGVGDATDMSQRLDESGQETTDLDYRGKLLLPGLVDCHVHFPQLDIIASYGEQLLDWLNRYAYPGEMRYADEDFARSAAGFFLDELLAQGTTTAAVFATVHPQSADAIFAAAEQRNMRLIAGKVLMDSNCPDALSDDPESGYEDSRRLAERWHGVGRLAYAITPRFALTSSEAQLEAAGQLAAEYPETWIHTHLAENHDEISEVATLFPWSRSYLDVYDHFGLLRERSVFAHCLHMDAADLARMSEAGGSAAFCPTSNLFLGSGLFNLRAMHGASIPVGLATDVGGGTSLSMFRTMSEAHKVLHLQGQNLPASRALYLATLGAAQALGLQDSIGNLKAGKDADFVVVDPAATPVMARRAEYCESGEELLFALMTLADDRHVAATYVAGQLTPGR